MTWKSHLLCAVYTLLFGLFLAGTILVFGAIGLVFSAIGRML